MRSMVDIDIILDEKYADPKVTIQTKERTQQVENIVGAIEDVSENAYPFIIGYVDDIMHLVSQRDIIRVYTQDRKVIVHTLDKSYISRKPLSRVEETLNPNRFIRISQSEIINLHKVKSFDINMAGTIGVEFDDGTKSWVARSRVKSIKNFLKNR